MSDVRPPTFPRWLSWLFIAVMGYMIFAARDKAHEAPVATPRALPTITHEQYPALAEALDMQRWKKAIDPSLAERVNCTLDKPKEKDGLVLSVIEEKPGEGAGAKCGEEITIAYTAWNAEGKKIDEAQMRLPLGSRVLAAGLDVGLLGMKPGAVRRIILPPYAMVRATKMPKNAAGVVQKLPEGKLVVLLVTRVR